MPLVLFVLVLEGTCWDLVDIRAKYRGSRSYCASGDAHRIESNQDHQRASSSAMVVGIKVQGGRRLYQPSQIGIASQDSRRKCRT